VEIVRQQIYDSRKNESRIWYQRTGDNDLLALNPFKTRTIFTPQKFEDAVINTKTE
jgi:predicted nucleic acid-binding protein